MKILNYEAVPDDSFAAEDTGKKYRVIKNQYRIELRSGQRAQIIYVAFTEKSSYTNNFILELSEVPNDNFDGSKKGNRLYKRYTFSRFFGAQMDFDLCINFQIFLNKILKKHFPETPNFSVLLVDQEQKQCHPAQYLEFKEKSKTGAKSSMVAPPGAGEEHEKEKKTKY